jgi:hypothetical protein
MKTLKKQFAEIAGMNTTWSARSPKVKSAVCVNGGSHEAHHEAKVDGARTSRAKPKHHRPATDSSCLLPDEILGGIHMKRSTTKARTEDDQSDWHPPMILLHPRHDIHKKYLEVMGYETEPCPLKGCYLAAMDAGGRK